jgi:hypothetical protein
MSRLPALHRDDLDETGQALWDQIVSTRSAAVVDEQGGLRGPFNPWVHAPEVGRRAADLGATFGSGVSVERGSWSSRSSPSARTGRRSSSGGRTCRWPESTA